MTQTQKYNRMTWEDKEQLQPSNFDVTVTYFSFSFNVEI